MRYKKIITTSCAVLAIYCLIVILTFTLVAYLELGFLPESGLEKGFSISHFLRYNESGVWYFYVLMFFQNTLLPALILFQIFSVPTLIILYYEIILRKETNFLFIFTFLVTHILLVSLYSRRLGIEEWVRCILCWYFD